MITQYCRVALLPETTHAVTVEVDATNCPDIYCNEHLSCKVDDVYFIEVSDDERDFSQATVWRCEVVLKEGGQLMIFSGSTTLDAMRAELQERIPDVPA